MKYYNPLFSFTVHCLHPRATLLEMRRRISKSLPSATCEHTASESGAERLPPQLEDHKKMMKGRRHS